MNSKTVFISGATGFIGQHVATRLTLKGHKVHALARSNKDLPKSKGIIHFQGDITDKESIKRAMESCTHGIHLAGFAKIWAPTDEPYFTINTIGAENVFEAALNCGLQRLVFTSTAGTIGPSYDSPANENHVRLHDFFSPYESSKFMAEEKALRYAMKGLPIIILNPTRVFGPGQLSESNGFVRLAIMFRKGSWKNIPGDGHRLGNYVFVDDVVDAHLNALELGTIGERYLLGGENISYNAFFDVLKMLSGLNPSMKHIPLWLMRLFAKIQVAKAKRNNTSPLISPEWIEKYRYDWAVDSSKAIQAGLFSPRTFTQGMSQTFQWLDEQGL
jgi:farnesol dehydrogenase